MINKTITVNNKSGLHARPAAELVKLAKTFESKLFISNGEKKVALSSPIMVMTLGVKCGTTLDVSAEGADEVNAVDAVVTFIENLDD